MPLPAYMVLGEIIGAAIGALGNAMASAPDYPVTRGSFSATHDPTYQYNDLFSDRARQVLVHPFGIRVSATEVADHDAYRISLSVQVGVVQDQQTHFESYTRNAEILRQQIEDRVANPRDVRLFLRRMVADAAEVLREDYNDIHGDVITFEDARFLYLNHRNDRAWERNHQVYFPYRPERTYSMRETCADFERYGRRLELQRAQMQAAQQQAHAAAMAQQQAAMQRPSQFLAQGLAGIGQQAMNMRPGQWAIVNEPDRIQRIGNQLDSAEHERIQQNLHEHYIQIRDTFGVGFSTVFHKKDSPAEQKALELLGELIDEETLDKYKKCGALWVPGERFDHVLYRDGDVITLRKGDRNGQSFCIGTVGKYSRPPTDNVIALKTLIETNERQFLSKANPMGNRMIHDLNTIAGYTKGG